MQKTTKNLIEATGHLDKKVDFLLVLEEQIKSKEQVILAHEDSILSEEREISLKMDELTKYHTAQAQRHRA